MKFLNKSLIYLSNYFSMKGKIERLQYEVSKKKRNYDDLNKEQVEFCLREAQHNEEYNRDFIVYFRIIAFWGLFICVCYALYQWLVLQLITPSTIITMPEYFGNDQTQFLAIHIGKFLISSCVSIILFLYLLIERYDSKNRFIKIQALENKLKELENEGK